MTMERQFMARMLKGARTLSRMSDEFAACVRDMECLLEEHEERPVDPRKVVDLAREGAHLESYMRAFERGQETSEVRSQALRDAYARIIENPSKEQDTGEPGADYVRGDPEVRGLSVEDLRVLERGLRKDYVDVFGVSGRRVVFTRPEICPCQNPYCQSDHFQPRTPLEENGELAAVIAATEEAKKVHVEVSVEAPLREIRTPVRVPAPEEAPAEEPTPEEGARTIACKHLSAAEGCTHPGLQEFVGMILAGAELRCSQFCTYREEPEPEEAPQHVPDVLVCAQWDGTDCHHEEHDSSRFRMGAWCPNAAVCSDRDFCEVAPDGSLRAPLGGEPDTGPQLVFTKHYPGLWCNPWDNPNCKNERRASLILTAGKRCSPSRDCSLREPFPADPEPESGLYCESWVNPNSGCGPKKSVPPIDMGEEWCPCSRTCRLREPAQDPPRETPEPSTAIDTPPKVDPFPGAFRNDLSALLNRHSKENASNTPDYVLARFLDAILDSFESAVNAHRAPSAHSASTYRDAFNRSCGEATRIALRQRDLWYTGAEKRGQETLDEPLLEDALERALTEVLQDFDMETGSNTPEFLLAGFLRQCLTAADDAVCKIAVHLEQGDAPRGREVAGEYVKLSGACEDAFDEMWRVRKDWYESKARVEK